MKMKNYLKLSLCFVLVCALLPTNAIAQENESTTDELLDMDFMELLNTPIVIASKKSESSFVAPLSTTVLSREEIEKSGVTSIEEAFRLVPGMIVRQRTNGNYDVQIRGNDNIPPQNMTMNGENTSTLIMVNGRKVFNYANGGIQWETLPVSLNDIQRIEIIRGPSTAMYGPNAASGVINIVTAEVKEKEIGVTASAQAGSLNTQLYNAAVSSSLLDNKLKLRVGGNYETFDRINTDYYSYGAGKYLPYPNFTYYTGLPTEAEYGINHFPNSALAKERKGVIGSIGYNFNKDINVVVEGGYQESQAQNVFIENQATPLTTRNSNTSYVNVIGKIYGLDLNLNNTIGDQNLDLGNSAAKVSMNVMDATAEYNFEFGNLLVRPGLSFQKAIYSDLDYAGATQTGFFNASNDIITTAGYLRGDYKATDKLRLIGAIRFDDYNTPNTTALTYQFAATYSINDKNFIRASYGRANKGPVMMDSYANYQVGALKYQGNPNLDLTFNNTAELGYRWMALKNLSIDAEVFYSVTSDPTVFEYSESLSNPMAGQFTFSYNNIDLESTVLGGSLSLNYVISAKYQAKVWASYSDNQLKNFDEKLTPFAPKVGSFPTVERKDIQNPLTPKFYGGASFTANPIEKLTAYLDCYFFGKSEYIHESDAYAKAFSTMIPGYSGSGRVNIDSRFTLNLKVSYDVYKNNQVFVNARNLLNTEAYEAGFTDPIGALYLVGVKIDL